MTTLTAIPPVTSPTEIEPAAARALVEKGEAILVDVREPDEHARERIAGAVLMPLGKLDPAQLRALGAQHVVIHCKSGRRGANAVARCAAAGLDARNVRGGIEAWRAAGLPTTIDAARPKLGIMQQTQIAIGLTIVAGTALGASLHPAFLVIPAFFGCGMVYAGLTGSCGFATLIGMLPWNRAPRCAGGSCATR